MFCLYVEISDSFALFFYIINSSVNEAIPQQLKILRIFFLYFVVLIIKKLKNICFWSWIYFYEMFLYNASKSAIPYGSCISNIGAFCCSVVLWEANSNGEVRVEWHKGSHM